MKQNDKTQFMKWFNNHVYKKSKFVCTRVEVQIFEVNEQGYFMKGYLINTYIIDNTIDFKKLYKHLKNIYMNYLKTKKSNIRFIAFENQCFGYIIDFKIKQ